MCNAPHRGGVHGATEVYMQFGELVTKGMRH